MTHIAYDSIKDRLAAFIRKSPLKRRLFYLCLDIIFLRSWHIRKRIKSIAKELNQQGEWQLLDAGCGFGQYERYLLSNFRNVRITSIDLKETYLDDCRRYFHTEKERVTFVQADLAALPYEEQFDLIICIDVMEHIEDDIKVLININKALRKGGYFLMHSPSGIYASAEDDLFVEEHCRHGYSKIDITTKMRDAGLSVVKVGYTYGLAGHYAWLVGIKFPLVVFKKLKWVALFPLFIYYLLIFPLFWVLNYLDTLLPIKRGRGIYAIGTKR